ncbi:hypothetical protein C5137_23540 [Bacillus cereus]|uniref:DUF6572 domain-containing protein n=1 Tax=Bacillus TaxID=1386 RepID=UPI0009B27FC9|nr:DUF6572 domain-containing protein [Bacillus cereus]MCO4216999.1 hypothetical protein [Bacillus sp. 10017]MRD40983.1 hypothetical protein [Bacillus thuringiensis]MCI3149112.1 hypothetical protein [Bacillus cereus]MEB8569714.1 hypothetical protein [Bacillus cereus]UYY92427.1 hypothetical protein OIU11_18485 [Bacillus cereus]
MKNKKGCKKYMNGYEVIDNQNTLFLSIVDTLDWRDEEAHVLLIYEAIHKYQAYVEEKRVNRIKSALETETRYVIQIFAQYECSEYGNDFYELINDLLQDIGVELKICIKNNKFIYI